MNKIFKPYELRAIEERKKGDKSDKNGVFSSRVKPKILEILSLNLEELKKLIGQ